MTDEDLIADEDVVVTISGRGYIKRQPVATYRRQHRGGKGIIGARHPRGGRGRAPARREHPRLGAVLHQPRPGVQLEGPRRSPTRAARPRASRSSTCPGVQVESGEVPMATITLPDFDGRPRTSSWPRAAGSSRRRRSSSSRRSARPASGRSPSREDDELAWVDVSTGRDDVIIATAKGKIARFHETEVRPMGRDAAGVIGIRLARKGDSVVGMSVVEPDSRPPRPDRDRLRQARAADRVPAQAPRRPGRPLIALEGARPATSPPSSWSPRMPRS